MARLPSDPIKKARKVLSAAVFGTIDLEKLAKQKAEKSLEHHGFYRGSMPIDGDIVPEVDSALDDACSRLGVPRELVHGFISNDGKVNASCWSSSLRHGEAIVAISAQTVERLCYDEMVYVFGHEIGHHLFPHNCLKDASGNAASFEDSFIARRMELFMDRIGLIACRKPQFAISAAMKVESGLGAAHLRVNVGAYTKLAAKGFEVLPELGDLVASHPPLYLRLRALSLFAESDVFNSFIGVEGGKPVAEINQLIETDLHNTVDKVADAQMKNLVGLIPSFFAAYAIVRGEAIAGDELNLGEFTIAQEQTKEWVEKMHKIPADKLDETFVEMAREVAIKAATMYPRKTEDYLLGILPKLEGKALHKAVKRFHSEMVDAFNHHRLKKSLHYS